MYLQGTKGIFDNAGEWAGDTLGFDWGQVVGQIGAAGAQTGLALLFAPHAPSGSNCLQGQVSGDEAMTNCIPRVMALFDQLEAQAPTMQPSDVVAAANQIAGIFSDNRYFDQNIGGRSRELREAAKAAAAARAQSIILRYGQAAGVTVDPKTGQTVAAPSAGISGNTLLLIGGGLVAVLLLLKR